MIKFALFFIFVSFSCQRYIIKRFIGFRDTYPEGDDSFVRVVPENNPYIGIFEQSTEACEILIRDIQSYEDNNDFLVLIGYS